MTAPRPAPLDRRLPVASPGELRYLTVICALALTAQALRRLAHRLAPWRY